MNEVNERSIYREWAHAPSHLFSPGSAYIVTAGTYGKVLFFNTPAKRDLLLKGLFQEAEQWDWQLQAWAIMANHYHFIARAPENSLTLKRMIMALHSKTAIEMNKCDNTPGRKVWYQYRDTCLTNERSYFARLNYVHHNPVKHGLTHHAENYRWCSMAWFMQNARSGFRRTVLSFPYDRIQIEDDF